MIADQSFSVARESAFNLDNLLFCTGSRGKIVEGRLFWGDKLKVLDPQASNPDLEEIQSLDPIAVAHKKLLYARQHYNSPWMLIEDTTAAFEWANPPQSDLQLPGTFIKFFAEQTDIAPRQSYDWMYERALKLGLFGAKACTTVGIIGPDESKMIIASRELLGRLVAPAGENGFGWDRIFAPNGSDKSFGQMTASEKIAISMRTQAFYAALRELQLRGFVSDRSEDFQHIDWNRVRAA